MNILLIVFMLIECVVGFGRAGWVNHVNRVTDRELLRNLIGQIKEYAAADQASRSQRRYRRSRY